MKIQNITGIVCAAAVPCMVNINPESRDDLIKLYFQMGLDNNEIVNVLKDNHAINVSVRNLKRHTARLQLYRRRQFSII